jgi:aspartyl/asparaginyl beta-hydroxylase (cupin superfamily)
MPSELSALAKAGHDALRRGDAGAAREAFLRATSMGSTDAAAWLGLALACRALKDNAGAVAAVERALSREPRNFRALIARADLYDEAGDARAASSYYTAALRHAPPAIQLSPEQASELQHAQQMCERYAREYEAYLRKQLAVEGFDAARSSNRFAQSLEMMMGRKQIFLQQPSQYYFPELPQIQFYERDAFPWLEILESRTDEILAELQEVMTDETVFRPYVERVADRPRPDIDRMTENPDWTAFYLWKNGEIVGDNTARCPNTLRALEGLPHCRIAKRTPSILFSKLRAGAKIPPHHGLINARLICHLPLIVPDGCGFRVGNDARPVRKGQAWVFDDTIEHEAWNNSKETRVILLFEIWRPELSDEERAMVATLLEAINSYSGQQTPLTI